MQTFLPISVSGLPAASCVMSARVLDRQRLGKQRVEALQILNTVTGKSTGWRNHPAVRMWVGHEDALAAYGRAMCVEWAWRGYEDNCFKRFPVPGWDIRWPWWFGDESLAASHRSNLLRKDATWYGKFGWSEPADLPYVWPV